MLSRVLKGDIHRSFDEVQGQVNTKQEEIRALFEECSALAAKVEALEARAVTLDWEPTELKDTDWRLESARTILEEEVWMEKDLSFSVAQAA